MSGDKSSAEDKTLRRIAWDMYYTGVVSISLHPGAMRDKAIPRTLKQCAELADEMLHERDVRFPP